MRIRIARRKEEEGLSTALKVAGVAVVGALAATVFGVFLARDQMVRHQRDLFSPHPLRRLAALGYLRSHPNVDNVMLLRDFLAWEERPLLRKRAAGILDYMERDLSAAGDGGGGRNAS
jgi:hypothetical protein